MSDKANAAAEKTAKPKQENQGLSADAAIKIFSDLMAQREGAIVEAVLAKIGPIVNEQVAAAVNDLQPGAAQPVPSIEELMEAIVPRVRDFIETAETRDAEAAEAKRRENAEREQREAEAAETKRRKAEEFAARAAEHEAAKKREACKEVYEAITVEGSERVRKMALLLEGEERRLAFADGTSFVASVPPIIVGVDELEFTGGHALYGRAIQFDADAPLEQVTEAWLLDGEGNGVRCAVGSGLTVGGGNRAAIPAGHLIF